MRFGKGSYFGKQEEFKAHLDGVKVPEQKKLSKEEIILKSTTAFSRENTEIKPLEFETEFEHVTEYSLGGWFRWLELKRMPWE